MTEDSQRNFRSVYYEKVGFRGVEEKKSLEILLKDDRLGEFYKLNLLILSHPRCSEVLTYKMAKDLSPSPFVSFPGGLYGSPVFKILPSSAPVVGLICSWGVGGGGVRIPCALWPKNQNVKKKGSNIVPNLRKT